MDNKLDSEIYKRLYKAKEFIDDSYCNPIDLEQISKEASISQFHFLRLFRRVYNKTPHKYLTEKRIDKAKQLLSKNELSVTDICFEIGFQSLGSFSTMFNKHVGYSPSEFRMISERKIFIAASFPEKLIPACFLIMR